MHNTHIWHMYFENYIIWLVTYILFYSILFYSILFYSILFYSILSFFLFYSLILCHAMLFYAMLCYAMLCYFILCYAMLWYAMLLYLSYCTWIHYTKSPRIIICSYNNYACTDYTTNNKCIVHTYISVISVSVTDKCHTHVIQNCWLKRHNAMWCMHYNIV